MRPARQHRAGRSARRVSGYYRLGYGRRALVRAAKSHADPRAGANRPEDAPTVSRGASRVAVALGALGLTAFPLVGTAFVTARLSTTSYVLLSALAAAFVMLASMPAGTVAFRPRAPR